MEKIAGIYKIRNKINNKFYLGSSIDIFNRWKKHKSELRCNKHDNPYLQSSWIKYGSNNFEFLIIEHITNLETLRIREDFWINETKCLDENVGYNLQTTSIRNYSVGIKTNLGKKASEKHKQKISNSLTKYYQDNEVSQETREKLRISQLGKKASKETKEKLRTSHLGNQSRVVYTKDQIAEFKKEIEQGATQSEVARKYKIAASTMSYILHKRL